MRLWLRLREQARLEAVLPVWLPEFLPRQRWFGGKGRTIVAARLEDAVWLETEEPTALVVAAVDYAAGESERFALLIGLRRNAGSLPLIGRLEDPERETSVVEAGGDDSSIRAVLRGFDPPQALQTVRGGTLHYGDVNRGDSIVLRRALTEPIRGLGVEQSNTAVAIGQSYLFKLFRKLDWGENPELEMVRFLTTRMQFGAVPALRGSLSWRSASGDSATLGLLQDWVDSRGDGWSHVLERLREIAVGSKDSKLLYRELVTLGTVTRDLHQALASDRSDPAFAPEPVTDVDVENWTETLRRQLRRVRSLLEENVVSLGEPAGPLALALVDALNRIGRAVRLPAIADTGVFHKVRVHGDFHLGQTLKTDSRFVLIDFEGEPARPLAERRLKQCALKDVAGMLRSFDYALKTGRVNGAQLGTPMRTAFLEGYLKAAPNEATRYLPSSQPMFDTYLGFFELDKALYEVEYELSHRPDWVAIPIQGALRILSSAQ